MTTLYPVTSGIRPAQVLQANRAQAAKPVQQISTLRFSANPPQQPKKQPAPMLSPMAKAGVAGGIIGGLLLTFRVIHGPAAEVIMVPVALGTGALGAWAGMKADALVGGVKRMMGYEPPEEEIIPIGREKVMELKPLLTTYSAGYSGWTFLEQFHEISSRVPGVVKIFRPGISEVTLREKLGDIDELLKVMEEQNFIERVSGDNHWKLTAKGTRVINEGNPIETGQLTGKLSPDDFQILVDSYKEDLLQQRQRLDQKVEAWEETFHKEQESIETLQEKYDALLASVLRRAEAAKSKSLTSQETIRLDKDAQEAQRMKANLEEKNESLKQYEVSLETLRHEQSNADDKLAEELDLLDQMVARAKQASMSKDAEEMRQLLKQLKDKQSNATADLRQQVNIEFYTSQALAAENGQDVHTQAIEKRVRKRLKQGKSALETLLEKQAAESKTLKQSGGSDDPQD